MKTLQEVRTECASVLGASLPITEETVTIKFITYEVIHIRVRRGITIYLLRKPKGKVVYEGYRHARAVGDDHWTLINMGK
jgi:hypothetical protein